MLIWEGDPTDPTLKPPEMYTLIENFCLGLRRLEIFGRARTLRRGWVSALAEIWGHPLENRQGLVLHPNPTHAIQHDPVLQTPRISPEFEM